MKDDPSRRMSTPDAFQFGSGLPCELGAGLPRLKHMGFSVLIPKLEKTRRLLQLPVSLASPLQVAIPFSRDVLRPK